MNLPPRKFFLLKNLRNISGSPKILLDSCQILTMDLNVFQHLQEAGRAVRGTWEYYSREDMEWVLRESELLKNKWYQGIESLVYREVNIAEVYKIAVQAFFSEALASIRIAEKFFRKENPSALILSAAQNVPTEYGFNKRSDVPEAIFAYCAEKLSVPVEWFHPKEQKKASAEFVKYFVPEILRKTRSRFLVSAQRKKQEAAGAYCYSGLEEAAEFSSKNKAFKILLVGAYQGFFQMLHISSRLKKYNRLLVHTGDSLDYLSALESPAYKDFISSEINEPFKYLELSKLKNSEAVSCVNRPGGNPGEFFMPENQDTAKHPEIFKNKHLEFYFKDLFTSKKDQIGRMVDSIYAVFEKIRPDFLLVGNTGINEQIFSVLSKKFKVPSVLIPHNKTWASSDQYDYPVDYLMVLTKAAADFMQPVVNPVKVIVDGLANTETEPNVPCGTKSRKGVEILVLPGGYNAGPAQVFDLGTHLRAIESLAQESGKKGWSVTFRSHPRSKVGELIKVITKNKGNIRIASDELAEDLIERTDAVLLLDYFSTPIYRAWKSRVPLISWVSGDLYYGPYDMFQRDWFPQIKNIQELERTIELFSTDEAWRREWLDKGALLAERFCAEPVKSFSSNLFDVINQKRNSLKAES